MNIDVNVVPNYAFKILTWKKVINVGNIVLKDKECHKFLGLIFQSNCKWGKTYRHYHQKSMPSYFMFTFLSVEAIEKSLGNYVQILHITSLTTLTLFWNTFEHARKPAFGSYENYCRSC